MSDGIASSLKSWVSFLGELKFDFDIDMVFVFELEFDGEWDSGISIFHIVGCLDDKFLIFNVA